MCTAGFQECNHKPPCHGCTYIQHMSLNMASVSTTIVIYSPFHMDVSLGIVAFLLTWKSLYMKFLLRHPSGMAVQNCVLLGTLGSSRGHTWIEGNIEWIQLYLWTLHSNSCQTHALCYSNVSFQLCFCSHPQFVVLILCLLYVQFLLHFLQSKTALTFLPRRRSLTHS